MKRRAFGFVVIVVGGAAILASEALHSVLLTLMIACAVVGLLVSLWVAPAVKGASPRNYTWRRLLWDISVALVVSALIYGIWSALVIWAAASS